jgi:His-Xaa-Ser system radical SAM maturase HxsC
MRLWSTGTATRIEEPILGRLVTKPLPLMERAGNVPYVSRDSLLDFGDDFVGYEALLSREDLERDLPLPTVCAPPHLDYLGAGDVVHLYPDGTVQVLYRRSSEHNSILTTERCNSFCLMCSQPPREVDDSHRVGTILRLLELISPEALEIGLTGGEPTLLGHGLFQIIAKSKESLPRTALHVLTNGRRFQDRAFARSLADIGHPDLMLGIPLYSDVDWRHDYVVQAKGAYDETMAGFYNLARVGIRIELRVVLHRQTVERLPKLATFIARNLPFVDHVALMGLEMFGFTLQNLEDVWIDPAEYAPQLEQATRALDLAGVRTYIFNHQLCTIPQALWPFAVKSISDWKNVYLPECTGCAAREQCGGFFQSATKRHSSRIRAIVVDEIEGRVLVP